MVERWAEILHPAYQLSNYMISDQGRVHNITRQTYSIGSLVPSGYRHFAFITDEKRQITLTIHRLVALAFVDNPNGFDIVDHIDGNKQNNAASNLQWVTNQKNMQKAQGVSITDGDRLFGSVRQAAIELGISTNGVYGMLARGELKRQT